MSTCTDVDAAIRRLEQKIDALQNERNQYVKQAEYRPFVDTTNSGLAFIRTETVDLRQLLAGLKVLVDGALYSLGSLFNQLAEALSFNSKIRLLELQQQQLDSQIGRLLRAIDSLNSSDRRQDAEIEFAQKRIDSLATDHERTKGRLIIVENETKRLDKEILDLSIKTDFRFEQTNNRINGVNTRLIEVDSRLTKTRMDLDNLGNFIQMFVLPAIQIAQRNIDNLDRDVELVDRRVVNNGYRLDDAEAEIRNLKSTTGNHERRIRSLELRPEQDMIRVSRLEGIASNHERRIGFLESKPLPPVPIETITNISQASARQETIKLLPAVIAARSIAQTAIEGFNKTQTEVRNYAASPRFTEETKKVVAPTIEQIRTEFLKRQTEYQQEFLKQFETRQKETQAYQEKRLATFFDLEEQRNKYYENRMRDYTEQRLKSFVPSPSLEPQINQIQTEINKLKPEQERQKLAIQVQDRMNQQGLILLQQLPEQIRQKAKQAVCEETQPGNCLGNKFDDLKDSVEQNQNSPIEWELIDVPVVKCELDQNGVWMPKRETVQVQVIKTKDGSMKQATLKSYESLADIETEQCDARNRKAISSIPDWWPARVGADRPQAVVQLRSVNEDGSFGSSYWSYHIPHYNKPSTEKPVLPEFRKGNEFAILTLKDNSQIYINASSDKEAEGVIESLIPYIDPSYLSEPLRIHTGTRKGEGLSTAKVKPIRILFYSTGQKNLQPDWDIDLLEDEDANRT